MSISEKQSNYMKAPRPDVWPLIKSQQGSSADSYIKLKYFGRSFKAVLVLISFVLYPLTLILLAQMKWSCNPHIAVHGHFSLALHWEHYSKIHFIRSLQMYVKLDLSLRGLRPCLEHECWTSHLMGSSCFITVLNTTEITAPISLPHQVAIWTWSILGSKLLTTKSTKFHQRIYSPMYSTSHVCQWVILIKSLFYN